MPTLLFRPPEFTVRIIGTDDSAHGLWVIACRRCYCSFFKVAVSCRWQRVVCRCCLSCFWWYWLLLWWLPEKLAIEEQQALWRHAGSGHWHASRPLWCRKISSLPEEMIRQMTSINDPDQTDSEES